MARRRYLVRHVSPVVGVLSHQEFRWLWLAKFTARVTMIFSTWPLRDGHYVEIRMTKE